MAQDTATGALPDFDALWDYSDPAATEAQFQAVLAETQASAPADYTGQLLTQIARTHSLRADFAAAHDWLDQVESLINAAQAEGAHVHTARVRLALERGRTYNSSGETARALPLFEEALKLAGEHKLDNYAVDAAHMLGIAAPGEQGLEWNLKAIAMAEAASEEKARKWLGALYNNTGWSLHDLGRFDEALALWEKGVQFRMTQNPQGAPARMAKWAVARCLRSMGRYEEALEKQLALQAEYAASGQEDGYVSEEIGENLLALGRADDARPHFARAYELLSKLEGLEKLEESRLARLRELSSVESGS